MRNPNGRQRSRFWGHSKSFLATASVDLRVLGDEVYGPRESLRRRLRPRHEDAAAAMDSAR